MLQNQQKMILSAYIDLYDVIVPKDNILRKIKELVDFSFVHEELKSKYCLENGRNAINPIRMFKYLMLKAIYDLSDVDIVERSKYDMSFKYFLDMAPEDPVIEPSSLTKFRKLRLQDVNLLDMLIGKVKGSTSFKAINMLPNLNNAEKKVLERVFNTLLNNCGSESDKIIDILIDEFASNEYLQ